MSARPITEDDLHAYVDNALDDSRRAEVEAYLQDHADVAGRAEAYGRQGAALREALDPVLQEPVPTRLTLAHMAEARRRQTLPPWRMAAAAAILLVVGGSGGWWLHGLSFSPSEGMLALAREASSSYSVYAPDHMRPVELKAGDSAELLNWASERMGKAPVLPDLSRSGYRLMGGRMLSTAHGAGLMLMYDNDHGTRLVMLTRPMAVDQNRSMIANADGDTHGWTWATNGMGYSLVGDVAPEMLHPLADEIRRQVTTNS